MSERFVGNPADLRYVSDATDGGVASLSDAALAAVAEILASEAGPDGKPSRNARKMAARILKAFRAGELDDLTSGVEESLREGHAVHQRGVPFRGPSGRWFVVNDAGHVVPHAAPDQGQSSPAGTQQQQQPKQGLLSKLLSAFGGQREPPGPKWEQVSKAPPEGRMAASPSYRAFAEQLDKKNAHHWERLGGDEGKKQAVAKCQALLDGLQPHIRVKSEETLGLILGGRFKNQFEVGRSEALYDPKGRAAAEQKGMGLPPDTPADQRPIYGYLTDGETPPDADAAANYGGIVVRLKDTVRERSTVSMGDSFRGAANGEYQASPLDGISHHAINPQDLANAGIDSLDDYPSWLSRHRAYIEIQMHGGTSAQDIEHIQFPQEPSAENQSRMKALGIAWSVYR